MMFYGLVGEWLSRGLQIPARRFDSGPDLSNELRECMT